MYIQESILSEEVSSSHYIVNFLSESSYLSSSTTVMVSGNISINPLYADTILSSDGIDLSPTGLAKSV